MLKGWAEAEGMAEERDDGKELVGKKGLKPTIYVLFAEATIVSVHASCLFDVGSVRIGIVSCVCLRH